MTFCLYTPCSRNIIPWQMLLSCGSWAAARVSWLVPEAPPCYTFPVRALRVFDTKPYSRELIPLTEDQPWFEQRPRKKPVGSQRQLELAKTAVRNREVECLRLRLEGLPLEEIADRVGYASAQVASTAIHRALKRDRIETHEQILDLEVRRLDEAMRIAWEIAVSGKTTAMTKLAAIDRIVKVQERRARFLGLDAPEQRNVTVQSTVDIQIQQLVDQLAAQTPPAPQAPQAQTVLPAGDSDAIIDADLVVDPDTDLAPDAQLDLFPEPLRRQPLLDPANVLRLNPLR